MNDVEIDFDEEYLKEKERKIEGNNENINGNEINMVDKKEKKIKIPGEEFEKIKTGIIFILKNNEKMGIPSKKNEVIGQYLENKYEEIEGEEQLNELTKKVEMVLSKLTSENFFYETRNEYEPENPFIFINVNFDIPDIFDV